jgi:hypothetical protein
MYICIFLFNKNLPLWILRVLSERVEWKELLILIFVVADNLTCQFQRGFTRWSLLRGWQTRVESDERDDQNGHNLFSHFCDYLGMNLFCGILKCRLKKIRGVELIYITDNHRKG